MREMSDSQEYLEIRIDRWNLIPALALLQEHSFTETAMAILERAVDLYLRACVDDLVENLTDYAVGFEQFGNFRAALREAEDEVAQRRRHARIQASLSEWAKR